MKYLLIIHGNEQTWESFPADELRAAIAAQDAYNRRYQESGELLGAYGLGDVAQARTVRVRDGEVAVTDGPYLETKEYLASFYLVDVEDEKRALELAAEIPFAVYNQIEVWPILHEAPPLT